MSVRCHQASHSTPTIALCCRVAGKEEDSRWLSGTYLLVHPAAKHLGNARVRVKVLLELKPQGSSRVNSRQWQVPQVAPAVLRAAPSSPVKPTGTPAVARAAPSSPANAAIMQSVASAQPSAAVCASTTTADAPCEQEANATGADFGQPKQRSDVSDLSDLRQAPRHRADAPTSPSAVAPADSPLPASAGTGSTDSSPTTMGAQSDAQPPSDSTVSRFGESAMDQSCAHSKVGRHITRLSWSPVTINQGL